MSDQRGDQTRSLDQIRPGEETLSEDQTRPGDQTRTADQARAGDLTRSGDGSSRRRHGGWWITSLLLVGVALIIAASLALAPDPTEEGAEAFGGTDARVTQILEEDGARPWFTPVFEPGSSEVESGLFALQAALGGGLLGFALGRLSARRRPEPRGPGRSGSAVSAP